MTPYAQRLFALLLLSLGGFVITGCVAEVGPAYVDTGVYYGPGPRPWFNDGYGHRWHHGGGYGFRAYRH